MNHIDLLVKRYSSLSVCVESVQKAYDVLERCFSEGKKLLIAGNGGSCADAQHIVGELMKGFLLPRKCSQAFEDKLLTLDMRRGRDLAEKLQGGLPAIALTEHQSLNTAYQNDVKGGGLLAFAQQIYAYGKQGDVFWGISTSGNAENVLNAAVVAKAKGMAVIGLTGESGGGLSEFADVVVKVPETVTYKIQELHLPVYHCLCLMLEEKFFG